MAFNPYEPYGPLARTTLRIASWNVWGRYGAWEERQNGIERVLRGADPDVVCLVESWAVGDATQPAAIADGIGREHHLFAGDWDQDGWTSGLGVVSRWPISSSERRTLPGEDGRAAGEALYAAVDGARGMVQVFVVVLDFPLGGSRTRQAQVRALAELISRVVQPSCPTIVCGDFNAGPDSDEVRMLTGKSTTAAPGLVFYDAWEMAGDGSPGHTWSNANPLAAVALWPDRRIDYILSAWPRAGGRGHPVRCELLGASGGGAASDHYGVLADLRY